MPNYARARKWRDRRLWLSIRIEWLYEWGTKIIWGSDGFKKHGFTHLFAELFFIDCPVCLFWRGLSVGMVISFTVGLLIWLLARAMI